MKTTNIEETRFNEFRKEVLTYDYITTEDLWTIIRSKINGNMGRRFFNFKLKQKYYTFWIKRLIKSGILTEYCLNYQGVIWKVNNEKMSSMQ